MTEEEEILEQLQKLEKGETVKMTINGEEVIYTNPPEPVVCSEHYYVEDRPEGEASACKCKWCPNGVLYDPREHVLKDGKLVKLGARL